MALRRTEMYPVTHLIATAGGLLGLFLGISLLSLIEIIAFCVIRLVSRMTKRRKPKHWNSRLRVRGGKLNYANILPPIN